MRRAIKILLLIFVSLTLLLSALVFELSPLVKTDAGEQVDNADSVPVLFEQVRTSLRSRYKAQTIYVSAEQADSIAGFLQRAINEARAQVEFEPQDLIIKLSYEISTFVADFYLNFHVTVAEGEGVNIRQVRAGKLIIPGDYALKIAEYAANTYTNSFVATKAISTVKSVSLETQGVTVELAPMDSLLREFKNIATGGGSGQGRVLKIRIAHYLRLLDGMYIPPLRKSEKAPSLAHYLHAVMKEAVVLSQHGSATLENEAAIVAIAIFAGSRRFATLTGDLSFALDSLPYAKPKPVLANRTDLSLHFIFSAAIKLLSEKGVSIAVGEFKELMDRGKGGSGYSFIDLAADLSGAHFASLAVDPKTAEHVQKVIASGAEESLFMVDISGLEEGMSKQEFEAKYSKVDSPEYLQVVELINARIDELPISP